VPRIASLKNRLAELESKLDLIILPDSTRWMPRSSGIHFCFAIMKLEHDLGRPAILGDFSQEDQAELGNWAAWHPNAEEHGGLAVMVSEQAREIVAGSDEP
jgi:hypothetical protein